MKIGRYRILFNPHKLFWFQAHKPTIVRQFGWFLLLREIDLTAVDKKQQFPIPTILEYEGRKYMYCKMGKAADVKGDIE